MSGAAAARPEPSGRPATGGGWLRALLRLPEPRARLICFPHAGGSAVYFYPWRTRAAPDLELYGVQYPGRMDRIGEACIEDMDSVADAVAAELAGLTDRPLALFGHSLGAAVAYEVARRLSRSRPDGPAMLFVSGRPAPDRQRPQVRHAESDEALWAHVSSLGGTRSEVLELTELRQAFLPPLRSDYRLSELYRPRPGPPLRCAVSAMIGDRDSEVDADEASSWAAVTLGRFRLHRFTGDHFYLGPGVDDVVATIRADLTGCLDARPDGPTRP